MRLDTRSSDIFVSLRGVNKPTLYTELRLILDIIFKNI